MGDVEGAAYARPERLARSNRSVVENLVALELAETIDGRPVLTPKGRSVLLRGSPRLLDLAA